MSQDTQTSDRKFFLFQANPKVWDLQGALRNQDLTEFNMSRLKGEVVPGSMVILWSSGERRGVYGLARVTSEVRSRTTNVEEFSNLDSDCVELEVVANWHDAPVLATEVEHFNWFPPVMQGSNFRSTAEAFFGLIEWRTRRNRAPNLEVGSWRKLQILASVRQPVHGLHWLGHWQFVQPRIGRGDGGFGERTLSQ